MQNSRSARFTRREAIGMLGMGAGAGLIPMLGKEPGVAAAGQATARSAQRLASPRGAVIRTILKDVRPESAGTGAALFHEHLLLSYTSPPPPPRQASSTPPTTPVQRADAPFDVALVVDELQAAAKDGLSCIVDAAIGPRTERQLENLRTIATRSGVHIVAAGGYYRAPYPPDVAQMTEDQIADKLVQDANAQRWGAFGEIGTSLEMHPDERKMIHAVSKAYLRTGLPILTHNPHEGCAKCALEQLDIYESRGVNPRNLCIGHLADIKPADNPGGETYKAIAKRGAFLGFDTVGHPLNLRGIPDIPEAQKVKMVLAVLEAGYEDHLLLSADFYNATELKANWGNGFSTVLVQFIPKLRHAGVKEATIRKILVDNPRRFLAFVPKKPS